MLPKQRTAMIVPIHDAYFNYGVGLVYASLGADYELVFVCTSAQDAATFGGIFPPSVRAQFRVLALDAAFDAAALAVIAQKKLWATTKKFHALFTVGHEFERAVCVDAETLVLQRQGWGAAGERILGQRRWYGGSLLPRQVGERSTHQRSLLELTPARDLPAVGALLQRGDLYTWWWDLPFYDCSHLPHFRAWMNWDDQASVLERLSWFAFDHVVYQAYTVLHCGFSFIAVNGHRHSLEFSRSDRVELVDRTVSKLSWVNALAYSEHPAYYRDHHFLAVYHMDRNSFPDFNAAV